MKARIKATCEVVDVYYETQHGTAMTTIYKEATLVNGRTFTEQELEFLTENKLNEDEHWQDVRERAAIAAMQSMIRKLYCDDGLFARQAAICDVEYADALVEQLKKKEQ